MTLQSTAETKPTVKLKISVTVTRVFEVSPFDYSEDNTTPEPIEDIIAAEREALMLDPFEFVEAAIARDGVTFTNHSVEHIP